MLTNLEIKRVATIMQPSSIVTISTTAFYINVVNRRIPIIDWKYWLIWSRIARCQYTSLNSINKTLYIQLAFWKISLNWKMGSYNWSIAKNALRDIELEQLFSFPLNSFRALVTRKRARLSLLWFDKNPKKCRKLATPLRRRESIRIFLRVSLSLLLSNSPRNVVLIIAILHDVNAHSCKTVDPRLPFYGPREPYKTSI